VSYAEQISATRVCRLCHKRKRLSDKFFSRHYGKFRTACKVCSNEARREWRSVGNNAAKCVTATREWIKANPDKARANDIRYAIKLKSEVMSKYSNGLPKCACCGESNLSFLTIDHINNSGGRHRELNPKIKGGSIKMYQWLRNMGYPKGYSVLCFNCNCGRALNKGVCPHELERNVLRAV
jgi:hypothetical protein